jgi:hypothetical protein
VFPFPSTFVDGGNAERGTANGERRSDPEPEPEPELDPELGTGNHEPEPGNQEPGTGNQEPGYRLLLMLPAAYQMPAAVLLLLGGAVACFFGYRLFRSVLAFAGFVVGGFAASSVFGVSDTGPMLVAFLVGGLVGAGVLLAGYFLGVALVGAGLGAAAAHLLFAATDRDPHFLVLVFFTIVGAAGAMYLQRYFIIVGTGFGGAWTLLVGAMALAGNPGAVAAAAGDVWVFYPFNPAPGQRWLPLAWIVLGLVGTGVQLGWTGGERGRIVRRTKKS